MKSIGIMQGRLSPPGPRPQSFPFASWQEEFERARQYGFDRIEWLLTADRVDDNPLWSDAGLRAIRELTARTGVEVTTLCADCFIARPLIGDDRRVNADLLSRVISRCRTAGIQVIVVPILETAAIRSALDRRQLIESLHGPLAIAAATGVRIALESDLPGDELLSIIDEAASVSLGVNYDTGNAAAAGLDCESDLRAIGSRLFGVHIKDRQHHGSSKPLGEGDTNFDLVVKCLTTTGYTGALILETPIGGDAEQSAQQNLTYLRSRLAALAVAS